MSECRILALGGDWPQAGPGWRLVASGDNPFAVMADLALVPADSALDDPFIDRLALPLLVAVGEAALPHWLDRADGFVLAGDDADTIATVAASVRNAGTGWRVAEQAGTAQHISALSAEAQRIADALAQLAREAEGESEAQVSAAMVRRLIRLRRDRDRHFPADLFGDPAWDMLLDLVAARMEGVDVAVSSLCVAAAVPTTTALRWVRSLSEAGIFVRRTDPGDARRAFITLSDSAHEAMIGWLRRFATVFVLR
ncbi:hypothetical protein [Sandarakinorhabdus sp. AAP62]|uniref:hypothetical protein n=1 Tax=Sandarakinorhabdus sp. AAP62 TaxID=1248916 RepID=UPI00126713FA|nr:hypothetical protein [Sandarakinorhabdus sp. AAP62]